MSLKSIKNLYQVDEVPFLFNIALVAISYAVALVIRLLILLIRHSSSITIDGKEHLEGNPILCHWHQDIAPFFCAVPKQSTQIWLQHPMWYMKPIHALLTLSGIQYILGSSGHRGKEAAQELSAQLQKGYSTTIFPDGPAGPAKTLKKGVIHIARQSRLDVVALKFQVKGCITLSSWDKKIIPLPFAKIHVSISKPITIGPDDEQASLELTQALGS